MKAHLMHRDREFDLQKELPWNEADLGEDLELGTLLAAMAGDDRFLFDVAKAALFSGTENDVDTILYRQAALRDCLKNATAVRDLYGLTVKVVEKTRRQWWNLSSHYADSVLFSSVELMESLLEMLKALRDMAVAAGGHFDSEAFTTLFAMLTRELDDEYLGRISTHLTELNFRGGVLLSAALGENNEGSSYELRQAGATRPKWLRRLFKKDGDGLTFHLDDRDEAGAQILSDMRQRGISRVAITLAQSVDHVLSFFKMLRTELAFYIGGLNLHDRLAAKEEPICFPDPVAAGERKLGFRGLYDVCLSLHMESRVVGNTVNADGKSLILVTGANQGGKSSFRRGVGLAQLMMQCGLFVGAEAYRGEICTALLTHSIREEDTTMKSGKFDEELARMSRIVDHLAPDALLLFNESFAATNEREGSEIARQIVLALLEKRVKILFVTHLYEFAHGLFDSQREDTLFLRAERKTDGTRTFRLIEAEPLATSFGKDLYHRIFERPA
ncbi:MAG: MutS-related protein [Terracidiphilus sp.]